MSVLKPRVMMTLDGGGDDDAGWKRRTLLMPVMHTEGARLGQTQGVLRSNWTQSRYSSNQFYRLLLPSGSAQVRSRCAHLLTATYTLQPLHFRDHNARPVTLNSAVFSKNYVFLRSSCPRDALLL